jgi:hypothetical protein
MKELRIRDVINRTETLKIFEALPVCILNKNEKYEGPEGFKIAILEIVQILQSISNPGDEMLDIVNPEDLNDITMFFSEKLYCIRELER